MQLPLVFSGIEVALRRGNKTVRTHAPFLNAADPNAMPLTSWPSIRADQSPVVLSTMLLNTKIVHNDRQIGKRGHEGPRKCCDFGSPHRRSPVVDGERGAW